MKLNTLRPLIVAGALVLGAGGASAAAIHTPFQDAARIQSDIYVAQRHSTADRATVVQGGLPSSIGEPSGEAERKDPFYFQEATAGSDRNAN